MIDRQTFEKLQREYEDIQFKRYEESLEEPLTCFEKEYSDEEIEEYNIKYKINLNNGKRY